jgi:hypothetical protein
MTASQAAKVLGVRVTRDAGYEGGNCYSIAVAIQTNTSDRARLTWDGFDISNRIVRKIEMACSR